MGLIRLCASCSGELIHKRPWQRYCKPECQNSDKVKRHRLKNAVTSSLMVYRPPAPLQAPLIEPQRRDFTTGPTPGGSGMNETEEAPKVS